jgi:DNA polymerase-4
VIVAHLDLDAFYAAVEELENPELRTQPLVVGGDPRGRGVVATANYVARRFGIHSAMSCAEALRRCPQAVFVRPRHTLYREYSRSVWETVRGVVPTVEQTGMDEGYLDIGAAIAGGQAAGERPEDRAALGGPWGEVAADFLAARVVAEAVRTAVRAGTSLTCSLGVAPCKVVAKVASDARKPGGLVVVPSGKEAAFLAPLAVRRLPGVGPKAEERLRGAEIETIGDLAALTDDDLRRLLPGSVGTVLRDRARGIDPRELELDTERISISVENTFEHDISDRERLHDELRGMAAEVAGALQRSGQVARTVTTKLRYADFSIRSRSSSLATGIDEPDTIADLACRLLDRGLRDHPGALRLVGVGVSGLADFRQLSLEAV